MNQYLEKIRNIMVWGGLTKEEYNEIRTDIIVKNRRYVLYFLILSCLAFFNLSIGARLGLTLAFNKISYETTFAVSVFLLFIYFIFSKKYNSVVNTLAYCFMISLVIFGYSTAVSAVEEKTTLFLIFLAVIPLLFTVKPIHMCVFIICSEIAYIAIISYVQKFYEVYIVNLENSIIITVMSLFIGMNVLCEKTISIYNAHRNKYLLETDVMTGLLNRRSFEEEMNLINSGKKYFAVVSFDVNGLKGANDNIGHHAGDELICGAATCILETFGAYGKCFRTGGDEFIAILTGNFEEDKVRNDFKNTMDSWKGNYNDSIHVSYGIALYNDYKDKSITEVIKVADSFMYKDKAFYYESNHLDRRKR